MSAVDAPLITKTEVGMLPKIHKISDLYIIASRALFIGAFVLIILISAWDKLSCNISGLLIFNILCAMMNISDMHVGLYFNRTLSTYSPTAKKKLMLLQLIASLTISIAIQIYGQITIYNHSSYTNCRKGNIFI
jgi:hypothetical protein